MAQNYAEGVGQFQPRIINAEGVR